MQQFNYARVAINNKSRNHISVCADKDTCKPRNRKASIDKRDV